MGGTRVPRVVDGVAPETALPYYNVPASSLQRNAGVPPAAALPATNAWDFTFARWAVHAAAAETAALRA